MAATVHQFVRSDDHQEELAESTFQSVNALPMAEAGGYRRRQTDRRPRRSFGGGSELASLTAASLASLGLWVAILTVLASLIWVVRG